MNTTTEPISLDESREFVECENKIRTGLKSFYEVGTALVKIRDKRLYRSSHESFEDYCRDAWGFGAKRAGQIIIASEVVESLPAEISTNCRNEGVARALAKVEPSKRAEVVQKAMDSGKVTASSIKEAAEPTPPTPPVHPLAGIAPALVAAFDEQEKSGVILTPMEVELLDAVTLGEENLSAIRDCINGHYCDVTSIADVVKQLGELRTILMRYQKEIHAALKG